MTNADDHVGRYCLTLDVTDDYREAWDLGHGEATYDGWLYSRYPTSRELATTVPVTEDSRTFITLYGDYEYLVLFIVEFAPDDGMTRLALFDEIQRVT